MGLISNGTTIFDAGAMEAGGGAMTLIKKLTASNASTLTFVDGASSVVLDGTYKEYLFTFTNIHADTRNAEWTVNFRDGGTDYDASKTSTFFQSFHYEADTNAALGYRTEKELTNETSAQLLTFENHEAADCNLGGSLSLFNPADTTFVTHYTARLNFSNTFSQECYTGGYCNTASAIDGVQFAMASGTFDGVVCLYGIN